MTSYQADKKSGIAGLGTISIVVGALFVGISLVSVVRELVAGTFDRTDPHIGMLIGATIGGAAVYLGWLYLWRRVYEVRLPGDGSVELVGAFRHATIASSELLELRRATAKIGFEEGDARELRVRSRQGTMLVPWFNGIELLVGEIQAQNPHIAVTGVWPDPE